MTRLILAALLLTLPLTACGHRGKLKTPAQAEADAEKKARKAVKAEQMEQDNDTITQPAPWPVIPRIFA